MDKQYHFIGVGGIGMSGIAQILLNRKFKVSGSDAKENSLTIELAKSGARVFIGHSRDNLGEADIVVYSSAIKEDNPELKEARLRGLKIMRRAEALAQLMKDETVVTVTGSHGKTTTSSLVSYLLLEAGLKPTLAVGGILRNIESNASLGSGRFFVAEADESDGSFLYYQPKYSIITNIDHEHLDYYKNFENALKAFREFLGKTREDGLAILCSDDHNLREMAKAHRGGYILFGLQEGSHIYPRNIRMMELSSEFDCLFNGKQIGRFSLALGGLHNISNALSVIALGLELGVEAEVIKKALAGYRGAKRRLEVKFKNSDYMLVDDYGHHPTEIKASLSALRNMQGRRMVVVFQPHRYSRTKLLLEDFSRSFDLADLLFITDIYPASETPIPGITGEFLCEKIKKNSRGKQVEFAHKEEIAGKLLALMKPGDLVVTLGAGDIVKVNDELVEALKRQG